MKKSDGIVVAHHSRVNGVLDDLKRPEYVWRDRVLQELYPETALYKGADGNGWRHIRQAITFCMSDPKITKYVRDGGSTKNPRFRRVEE